MSVILVTGGAGFIGSNFIRFWLSRHPRDHVVNFDALTYAGCIQSLADVEKQFGKQYSFVKGSIVDTQAVLDALQKFKPDMVVNFAAESHNSRAIVNPGIFFETNSLGTQRLLDAVRKVGTARFHHISTCEVFGDLPLDSTDTFTEMSPYRPRTPYNASKAAADMAVRAYHLTFNVPVTISNCANNYGPYQFPEKVIPHFIIKGLQGEKLPLYHSSKNKREWIHVLDHCSGIERILDKGVIGETYNIGTEYEADVEAIASSVIKNLHLDASVKTYVADRPGHDRRYLLNSSKIKAELGWKPVIDFDEGMRETVCWYVDHRDWWEPLLSRLDINEESWATQKA